MLPNKGASRHREASAATDPGFSRQILTFPIGSEPDLEQASSRSARKLALQCAL